MTGPDAVVLNTHNPSVVVKSNNSSDKQGKMTFPSPALKELHEIF